MSQTVALRRREGERLLAAGCPILAYDSLVEGLTEFPDDIRLRQLLALALARSGASRAAIPLLEGLRAEGHVDEETLGLLARVHKDLSADGCEAAERQHHLQEAYRHYAEAHRLSGGIWSGINAASMALLLGQRGEAARLARLVLDGCLRAEQDDPTRSADYWHVATIGEAQLILGDWPAAEAVYARAAELGRARVADTASTRRNARLIIRAIGADGAGIERSLRVPCVVAFAGHLIDRPDRPLPRFPPALEAPARAAIRERLQQIDAGFGYASAASGADILFLESLSEMQAETNIVLPYGAEQFERDSVDLIPGADWGQRYRRALDRAHDVVVASARRMAAGQMSYEYAVMLIEGLSGVRADALDTELVPLVLWDRKSGGGPGGTAETVARWSRGGSRIEVIDLDEIARAAGLPMTIAGHTPAHPPSAAADASAPGFEPQIVALLFADAHGFSALGEDQIPAFVERFLGAVAAALARSATAPILKNTWGDGLYLVFDSVRAAGLFALDLTDTIVATDWSAWGLPREMTLRIGLHAGPAYACIDPVTGRLNYLGAHVSRAARIEPITPPGQVYASGEFAAVARAERVTDFHCEYVGRTPMPKSYGTLPMYVIRRRFPAAGA
jgi:class 3 adenylate cyclase